MEMSALKESRSFKIFKYEQTFVDRAERRANSEITSFGSDDWRERVRIYYLLRATNDRRNTLFLALGVGIGIICIYANMPQYVTFTAAAPPLIVAGFFLARYGMWSTRIIREKKRHRKGN